MNKIFNTSPEVFSTEKNSTNKASSLVTLTLAAVVSTTTPDIAQAQQSGPLRPYGISGGQGSTHIASAVPIYKIQEANNNTKYETLIKSSEYMSSLGEMQFFGKYFGVDLHDAKSFVKKVKNLQKRAGFAEEDQDGIIGPDTLRMLYTKYYSKTYRENPNALPKDIRARWKFYKVWQSSRYQGFKKPDVFTSQGFYGIMGTKNIPGTLKDASLDTMMHQGQLSLSFQGKKISISEQGQPNSIYIGKSIEPIKISKKKQGKQRVFGALYDSNGQLQVLAYISPGSWNDKSPQNVRFTTKGVAENYISEDNATMANATLMDFIRGIHIHHSDKVNGSPLSHGCYRTTGIGSQAIAMYTAKKQYIVTVGNLYN